MLVDSMSARSLGFSTKCERNSTLFRRTASALVIIFFVTSTALGVGVVLAVLVAAGVLVERVTTGGGGVTCTCSCMLGARTLEIAVEEPCPIQAVIV